MDELIDMIVSDDSSSKISDKIKDILFAKSSEKVDALRPSVAASLFSSEHLDEE